MACWCDVGARCVQVINVGTSLACSTAEDEVPCAVNDRSTGLVYDLTPLMRTKSTQSNWKAIGKEQCLAKGGGTFYLNVCAPLVGTPQGIVARACPRSAAVCAVFPKARKAFSVGTVARGGGDSSPVLLDNGNLRITYAAPGQCVTSIEFVCFPGSLGEPHFVKLDTAGGGCVYRFNWRTSAACGTKPVVSPADECKVTDARNGMAYDLTPLRTQVRSRKRA